MQVLVSHRKCMSCGTRTENLNQDKCSCGAYMYMIGFIAAPKVVQSNRRGRK